MNADDVDPILVAADWLPRLPHGARGMVVTLVRALERERAAHAITRAELQELRATAAPEPVAFAPRLAAVDTTRPLVTPDDDTQPGVTR